MLAVSSLTAAAQFSDLRIAPRQGGLITGKMKTYDGSVTSTNWSGYAVTGQSFTTVTGAWIVPPAVCWGGGQNYSSFWVGLDGYNSPTVEQIGTESDCNGLLPTYYSWFELYPGPSWQILTLPVRPGDHMVATVSYSAAAFTLSMTNQTTGRSYTRTATIANAQLTSAEWIAEAPCCAIGNLMLPMTDFSLVFFGKFSTPAGTNTAASGSTSGVISAFGSNVDQIKKTGTLTSPQTSTCTTLGSDGASFSCAWAP